MKYLVTGCAGFVGSTLVDRLLADGHRVVGIDDFSTGRADFLEAAAGNDRFRLLRADLLDPRTSIAAARGCDAIFHIAAHADVRHGTKHPTLVLEQNTRVTVNVLEAARLAGVRDFVFSSTGSVYGETEQIPTPEDAPIPLQTSLYGASKMAAECFIQAYAEGFGMRANIFRFVSLLGERYTHGHVVDFYAQLREHPDRLHVLGNGRQRKSYLDVGDCIEAVLTALDASPHKVGVYNLGTDEYCTVDDSIGWISETLGVTPARTYAGGDRGWIGDNPFIFLDCSRMRSLGWAPTVSIRDAVVRTVRWLERDGLRAELVLTSDSPRAH